MVGVAFICCKNNKKLIFYQNFQYNHPRKNFFLFYEFIYDLQGYLRSKVRVPNESPIMTSSLMLILNACVSGTILRYQPFSNLLLI